MSFYTFHPPYKAELAGEDGIITPAWRVWTQNIFDTTGSADGQLKIRGNGIVSIKAAGTIDVAGDPALYVEDVKWPNRQTPAGYRAFQYTAGTLSLVDGTTLGAPSTGDIVASIRTSKTDWVAMNDGTIGNASSGASTRANADTEILFELMWNGVTNTYAPVSSGRGVTAQADFDANKTLTLPRALGRIMAAAGTGTGLTARALGVYVGAETHTLALTEIPGHAHDFTAYIPGGGTSNVLVEDYTTTGGVTMHDADTTLTGGFGSHANMQPTTFLNYFIKL